jgi:hypothetical protein
MERRRFINVFTKVPYPERDKSILIFSSYLRLGLPGDLYPCGFPTNIYAFLFSPMRATCPAHLNLHVKWVSYHHGIARPWVTDGGDVLQIWRAAVMYEINIRGQPTRSGPVEHL